MNRPNGSRRVRPAPWQVFHDDDTTDAVQPRDLIRPPRAPTAEWTVFNDMDAVPSDSQRRARRDSLVRRRPTEWNVEKDTSESNKENIGYEVRRPKRARPAAIETRPVDHDDHGNNDATHVPDAPSTPAAPPRSNGKRKLKTPSPPQDKALKKPKKSDSDLRPETPNKPKQREAPVLPAPVPTPTLERVRRPLEDITHLFIDPAAHYFQPWRRASRLVMRAASMRLL